MIIVKMIGTLTELITNVVKGWRVGIVCERIPMYSDHVLKYNRT